MNNRVIPVGGIMSLALVLAACATTPAVSSKTSLWEVSSAQRTVYIASDTQMLAASDYPLPAPFAKAFAASGALYVEQIPGASKQNQAQIHALILQHGVLDAGQTLANVMTPSQLTALQTALKAHGMAYAQLEHLQPWLVALSLGGHAAGGAGHEITPQAQITSHFYQQAEARGMPVTPFESYAKLFDITSSLPMVAQVNWLMNIVKQDAATKDQPAKIRKLVAAWRGGDQAGVKALSGSFENVPIVRKALVVDRNKAWVQVIETKLRSAGKPIFVIVGDGHLLPKDNMLVLLHAAGFQVRQL